MEVYFNNVLYKENDIIEFVSSSNTKVSGVVKFGLYEDDEMYSTQHHLGFYIEYYSNWHHEFLSITLPDALTEYQGELVK